MYIRARIYVYTDTCDTYTRTYIHPSSSNTHILAPSFAFGVHVIAGLRSHECFEHALFSSCHRKSFQKFTPVNAVMYYSYFHCKRRLRKSLKNKPRKSLHRFPEALVKSSLYCGCCFIVSFTFMGLSISYTVACAS